MLGEPKVVLGHAFHPLWLKHVCCTSSYKLSDWLVEARVPRVPSGWTSGSDPHLEHNKVPYFHHPSTEKTIRSCAPSNHLTKYPAFSDHSSSSMPSLVFGQVT